jgi:hypothetical protein
MSRSRRSPVCARVTIVHRMQRLSWQQFDTADSNLPPASGVSA